ncbi:hypothetical protein CORC01_03847 [Colletotrichum orchidophilum]|uniref:Uncharacterized protein n=1 Tax=Colletotrichum orchidophilum TaxID=1209926 RepID=A0A1G4BHH2_9PEZI|nr:uncharacterized protein CORC01_03847 [Colletotrichum orchidophilum]OHF00773.1 hypothetical protein CORC01_03847 [Colletotrichum orchidophilum]
MNTRNTTRRTQGAGPDLTPNDESSDDGRLPPLPPGGSDLSASEAHTEIASSSSTGHNSTSSESSLVAQARVPIPDQWIRSIVQAHWGRWAYNTKDDPNCDQINAALVFLVQIYQQEGFAARPLFYRAVANIGRWPDDWFRLANEHIAKAFIRFLHGNGVLPDQTPARHPYETLAATVRATDFTVWSQEQVNRAVNRSDQFAERIKEPGFLLEITNGALSSSRSTPGKGISPHARSSPDLRASLVGSGTPARTRLLSLVRQDLGVEVRSTGHGQRHLRSPLQYARDRPDLEAASVRQLTDRNNIVPREKNDSGGRYAVLQETVVMSYDYCEEAGIQDHQCHSAVTIALTGRAKEYHYQVPL